MQELKLRVADVLARRLYTAGCRYAFGMPGGGPPGATTPAPGPMLHAGRAALAGDRRPLLIVGLDAINDCAGPALTAFA